MIQGIGTDIIEIERIKKAMAKPAFLMRCFTDVEIEYFVKQGMRVESVAGTFAAKEAVSKTLGTGFGRLSWKDVEIIRDAHGKPHVKLSPNGLTLAEQRGIRNVQVSISHCKEYAVAFSLGE